MRCVSLALGVLVSGLASLPVVAQQITWTAGFVNAIGSSYVETIKTVPARIEAATKGRLKIELYDTLVAGPEQPAAVRDGRLDSSFAVSPWLSAEARIAELEDRRRVRVDVTVDGADLISDVTACVVGKRTRLARAIKPSQARQTDRSRKAPHEKGRVCGTGH